MGRVRLVSRIEVSRTSVVGNSIAGASAYGIAILASLLLFAGCGKDKKAPTSPVNSAPAAAFTVLPASGSVATLFSVDASGTSDVNEGASSLQVRWDWESDGVWDTAYGTAKNASHQYADSGTKTIRLEAKDSQGLTGTATRAVHVTAVPPPPQGFVLISPGTLTMGSPNGEIGRDGDEIAHQVTLSRSIYIARFEVTQAEWQDVMGWNDSGFHGASLPVETVTWFDAATYCNSRSTREGRTPVYTLTGVIMDGNHVIGAAVTANGSADGYRLPTEAEWECACRAGSNSAFSNGEITNETCADPVLAQVAWYCGNALEVTHDVGSKVGNAWDLYDMHGNVFEWCWDWYAEYSANPITDPVGPSIGAERIARGGYWNYSARGCRAANRFARRPGGKSNTLGLRVVRAAQ